MRRSCGHPQSPETFAAALMKTLPIVFIALAAAGALAADPAAVLPDPLPPELVNPPNGAPYTKLFLAKVIEIPFRLLWRGYDGDPKKNKPEAMSFQVDTIDMRQPSAFLKLGDMVPGTRFKLLKFEPKGTHAPNAEEEDVSELTLVNVDTGKKLLLVLNRIANAPELTAVFAYERSMPAQMISVKKNQDFVLRPEVDEAHRYKLLDVNDAEAVIRLPSGEFYKVKPHPPKLPGE